MLSYFRKLIESAVIRTMLPIITGIIIYSIFIYAPPPFEVTRIVSFRTSYIMMGILILFFFAIWRQNSFFWNTASLVLTLAFFSLSILYKWQVPVYSGNLIGGLLPWSDAGNYFNCGNQLLINGKIDVWCARRPIFPLFWGSIYGFTGLNLKLSISILVMLNALALYFAAREIRQISHSLASAIFILFSFIYYYNYAGTVLTENLGLALGSLALACLLRGERQDDEKISAMGLLLISLALNARAGAFFILPLLLLWFINRYRGKMPSWSLVMSGFIAIALPFFLNVVFLRTLSQPGSTAFSNYAHTFYGLAAGNKGWTQIQIDHPNASEAEYPALALEKFKENPLMLVWGILGAYGDYFKPIGAFSYLTGPLSYSRAILLWLAFGVSLYIAWIRRKSGLFNLILLSFCGIFFSVGLLPPKDADARVYAATIPFTNMIFSIGVVTFLKIRDFFPDKDCAVPSQDDPLLLPYVALLCLAIIGGPYLVKSSLAPLGATQAPVNCAPGQDSLDMVSGKSSTVILDDFTETFSPMVRLEDFINGINLGGLGWYPNLDAALLDLTNGDSLTIGFDPSSSRAIYLISPARSLPGNTASFCASPTKNESLKAYSFYYYNPPLSNSETTANADMLDSYQPNRGVLILLRYVQIGAFLMICLVLVKDNFSRFQLPKIQKQ